MRDSSIRPSWLITMPLVLVVAVLGGRLVAVADGVCGNGVVEIPETCDDGGTCIGGANAGTHCTKEPDCIGDGVCQGGMHPGRACSADDGCGGGQCFHCVPFGGDGCAANCTTETDVSFNLVPGVVQGSAIVAGTSSHPVQSDVLTLPYPLAGALTLTIGQELSDGRIPIAIKAAAVHLDRVHLPALGAGCLCARAVSEMTCGGTVFEVDGTPSLDCAPGFTAGSSVCAGSKPCTAVYGSGNSAAGTIACNGGIPDALAVTQDGTSQDPPVLTLSGAGVAGAALVIGTSAYAIGACSGTDLGFLGPDGELCTDDDPPASRGAPVTELFVSRTATATVLNANGTSGATLGPLSTSGAPFSCSALLVGNPGGACLASASSGLGAPTFGDFVSGTTWCAAPAIPGTPLPTATPTPTPTPIVCVGDCDGDGAVTVNELITGVNIALGNVAISACPAFDCCGELCVEPTDINCIIRGVNNALLGCPRLGLMCGGFAGVPCAFGEVCDIHDPTCTLADAGGTCAASSHICPEIFAPECGCDGVTYSNACFRLQRGVTLRHTGPCA